MNRKANSRKHRPAARQPRKPSAFNAAPGVTLVELIVASLILAVAAVGALSYQYHAVKRARIARAEISASQLAQLLIEDWKSRGGDTFYDPADLELGFEKTGNVGQYKITLNDFPMWVELQHEDLEVDDAAGVTLREIRITISWRRDYENITPAASDPTFTTTTYVRRDQSGG